MLRPLILTLILVTTLGCGPLAAQLVHDYVSPENAQYEAGRTRQAALWVPALSRVQQIDPTLAGTRLTSVRALGFLRPTPRDPAGVIHRPTMEVRMAHAVDPQLVSTTFARNYKGAPTIVFAARQVDINFVNPPVRNPPRFDARIPFDSPFPYNRVDPILWETKNLTGSIAPRGYEVDFFLLLRPGTNRSPRPTPLSTGCRTGNGFMVHGSSSFSTSPALFHFEFTVLNAPSGASAVMLFGNDAINVPLFCGRLRVGPILATLPLGRTDSRGNLTIRGLLPWRPELADNSIVTQIFAPDATLPSGVAISNGLHSRTSRVPGGVRPYDILYSSVINSVGPTGSPHVTGGIATKFFQ